MNWTHRDELGHFLNEAGLCGAGVEVGAAFGQFSTVILARWRGRELALVDAWEPQERAVYFDISNGDAGAHAAGLAAARQLAAADPRVRLVRGESPAVAARFPDESLDFIYIDANHAYLAVAADLRAWYTKLRPGGLFAGHDYLDGIYGDILFGVQTAVDDFAAQRDRAPAFTTADPPFASWYFFKPIGPTPRADRITVVTGYDAGYRAVGDISRANKEAYCRRHGYRFVCRTDGFDTTRPPAWSKIRFIRDELPSSDWVFWTDADSLVMNSAVPLSRFVQDSVDVVLSGDPYHGINTGCLFVRNTPWSVDFLDRVYARTDCLHHPWWENAAIMSLYAEDPEVRRHALVVPNKLFNGFPYPGGQYSRGDFLAHLPGCSRADRVAAIINFAAMAR